MSVQAWTFLFVGATFGLYLVIAWRSRDISERKKAHRDLEESRALLQQLIDGSPSSIYAKDREGRFTVVNKAFLKDVPGNPPREDVIGKNILQLFPEYIARPVHDQDMTLLAQGNPSELEQHIEGSDYLVLKYPLRDTEGNVVGVSGLATNVTPLKDGHRAVQEAKRTESRELRMVDLPGLVWFVGEPWARAVWEFRPWTEWQAPLTFHVGGTLTRM